jgi:hypothetical protein
VTAQHSAAGRKGFLARFGDISSEERFWSKVDMRAGLFGCWPWTGAVNPQTGYGNAWLRGKCGPASRIALSLHLGRPVHNNKQACHTCDNRPCCNPAHLYEGTRLQNMRDAAERERVVRGSRVHNARLSEGQVLEMRRLAGSMTQARIAARFGVTPMLVSRIIRRDRWAWLREAVA